MKEDQPQQFLELEILTQAVTVWHGFPEFKDRSKLSRLWGALNRVEGDNLEEAVENLEMQLRNIANDRLLNKSLRDFVSENAKTAISNDQKDKVLRLSLQR